MHFVILTHFARRQAIVPDDGLLPGKIITVTAHWALHTYTLDCVNDSYWLIRDYYRPTVSLYRNCLTLLFCLLSV